MKSEKSMWIGIKHPPGRVHRGAAAILLVVGTGLPRLRHVLDYTIRDSVLRKKGGVEKETGMNGNLIVRV